jgi:transposase
MEGIEDYIMQATSVSVSREHRRAKSDRRTFEARLREVDHCRRVAVPTLEEENAKRPNRERENLIGERTRIVNRL